MNVNLTNTAQKLCVIGDPVTHSKSPLLHNAMNQILGLDYLYLCQPAKPSALPDFLAGAKALGYAGFNATMPFKELLIPYLDELEPVAAKLNAVNTVCIKDGKLYGYNTDCPGYIAALAQRGFDPAGKRAVVLGAGGAAKAVALGLFEGGAEVTVVNRTLEKAQAVAALCDAVPKTTPKVAFESPQTTAELPVNRIQALSWSDAAFAQILPQADLLVNATSLGMEGQKQFDSFDFLRFLPKNCLVSDLIYHPAPTRLLREAAQLGLATMDGFPLLIHQAILAFEHFSGTKIDKTQVLPVLEQLIRS